jgi:hypothetical protein
MDTFLLASSRPLTADLHRDLSQEGVYLHVFVRGADVTDRCYFADDRPGHKIARLFKLDADGHFYVDQATGLAARETLVDDSVEIREGDPL